MKKRAAPSSKKPSPSSLQPKKREQPRLTAKTKTPLVVDTVSLLSDMRRLIDSARQRIATVAYSTQTLLCWHLGRRLLHENLQGGRAAYGKQILVTVSRELSWSRFMELLPFEHAREQASRLLPGSGEQA